MYSFSCFRFYFVFYYLWKLMFIFLNHVKLSSYGGSCEWLQFHCCWDLHLSSQILHLSTSDPSNGECTTLIVFYFLFCQGHEHISVLPGSDQISAERRSSHDVAMHQSSWSQARRCSCWHSCKVSSGRGEQTKVTMLMIKFGFTKPGSSVMCSLVWVETFRYNNLILYYLII